MNVDGAFPTMTTRMIVGVYIQQLCDTTVCKGYKVKNAIKFIHTFDLLIVLMCSILTIGTAWINVLRPSCSLN